MLQIIKFKINYILERKAFLFLNVLFFVILNLVVYSNTKIFTQGSAAFNYSVKYEIFLNNFVLVSLFFGIIYACYLGICLIGDDINTGRIYIILTSYPCRKKYYLACLLSLALVAFGFIVLVDMNCLLLAAVIGIKPMFSDMLVFNKDMLLNSAVIIVISAAASLVMNNKASIVVSVIAAIFFCLYTTGQIPVVNLNLDLGRHIREIMALLFPIRMIMLSYIDKAVKSLALVNPFGIHLSLVQLCYIPALAAGSIMIFKRKHL